MQLPDIARGHIKWLQSCAFTIPACSGVMLSGVSFVIANNVGVSLDGATVLLQALASSDLRSSSRPYCVREYDPFRLKVTNCPSRPGSFVGYGSCCGSNWQIFLIRQKRSVCHAGQWAHQPGITHRYGTHTHCTTDHLHMPIIMMFVYSMPHILEAASSRPPCPCSPGTFNHTQQSSTSRHQTTEMQEIQTVQ